MEKVILVLTVFTVALHLTHSAPSKAKGKGPGPNPGHGKDVLQLLLQANNASGEDLSQADIKRKKPSAPATGVQGQQTVDPCTYVGCKWPKSNNGLVNVPIQYDAVFTNTHIAVIKSYLKDIEDKTCVRFVPYTPKDLNYLSLFSGSGCWSYIGMMGGKQPLSLRPDGCMYQSVIQHEFLHALGFEHEHSRIDRDDYIDIYWENISPAAYPNFERYETNNMGTPYDFGSLLHYSDHMFSINNDPTIVPVDPSVTVVGGASYVSDLDIKRINLLYECAPKLI